MKSIDKQKDAIVDYFKKYSSPVNALDGFNLFGTMKLSTRIGELEREGRIPILKRDWVTVKTRFCNTVKVRTYQL